MSGASSRSAELRRIADEMDEAAERRLFNEAENHHSRGDRIHSHCICPHCEKHIAIYIDLSEFLSSPKPVDVPVICEHCGRISILNGWTKSMELTIGMNEIETKALPLVKPPCCVCGSFEVIRVTDDLTNNQQLRKCRDCMSTTWIKLGKNYPAGSFPHEEPVFLDTPATPPSPTPPTSSLTTFSTGAVRSIDASLVRYDLISPIALRALAETCAEGAAKYGDFNWEKGMPAHDMLNHAIRHIFNFLEGDQDENHLAHALWNVMGAIHSVELWPDLNEPHLRRAGCRPPTGGEG